MSAKERGSSTSSQQNLGSVTPGAPNSKSTREEKLLLMMEKLKSKYRKKEEENKMLQEQINGLINVSKNFEENLGFQNLFSKK